MPHAAAATALLAMLTLLPTLPARASGRVEINQATVDAAGGFPFAIGEPGSYVLTGDLTLTENVDALVFTLDGPVTLDLNGFQIIGTSSCVPGACGVGGASGVVTTIGAVLTVRDGAIRNFSGHCIDLGGGGFVEELYVSQCGRDGISIVGEGLARANRVENVGSVGIDLGADSLFAHNLILRTDLRGTGARAVERGTASAGNLCDDGSCSPRGTRRYYMTPEQVPGNQVLTACDPGFHTASIHEIWETSTLEYDTTRGIQQPDSGLGPPAGLVSLQPVAWARSGGQSLAFDFLRDANCALWTSADNDDFGGLWKVRNAEPSVPENERWQYFARPCNESFHVWCVED